MNKLLTLSIFFFFLSAASFAQHAHFTTSGTVEFEKRVNAYAVINRMSSKDNDLTMQFDDYKQKHPQFKVLKSTLFFANNKTLFKPAEEDIALYEFMANSPVTHQKSVVYSDLSNGTGVFQKTVFDELYLVKDSLRKIKWKITDETREIAGYTCRRANGVMLDSVYVVAFYTTEIKVSGGPESFNGLPGMILGVALPHENVTWFATKVTDMAIAANAVTPPLKGKPMTYKTFLQKIHTQFADMGSLGPFYYTAFSL